MSAVQLGNCQCSTSRRGRARGGVAELLQRRRPVHRLEQRVDRRALDAAYCSSLPSRRPVAAVDAACQPVPKAAGTWRLDDRDHVEVEVLRRRSYSAKSTLRIWLDAELVEVALPESRGAPCHRSSRGTRTRTARPSRCAARRRRRASSPPLRAAPRAFSRFSRSAFGARRCAGRRKAAPNTSAADRRGTARASELRRPRATRGGELGVAEELFARLNSP